MRVQVDAATKLREIEETQGWLRGLGLKVDNTRYDLAKKLLRKGVDEGEIDEDQMLKFQWALQDIDDFLQVHAFLEEKSSPIRKVLEKTLKGAVAVLSESPGKPAAARNYMFELVIASRLVEMGYDVRFDLSVDLGADCIVNLNGVDIYVECKRSLGDAPDELLHEAFKQIQTRCKANAGAPSFGIAAVCYTPLIARESNKMGPLIGRADDVSKNMTETTQKLRFGGFSKYCPPGLGVITHFTVPFWESEDMHLILLRKTNFHGLVSEDHPMVAELGRNWRSPRTAY